MTKEQYIERYGIEAYQEHLRKGREYQKTYQRTDFNKPQRRAQVQIASYLKDDKKVNRHFTATPITYKWILGRIYTSTCFYCGESDWKKLGCDRIDNNLPHQIDNCIPCCEKCNKSKKTKGVKEFYQKIHQPGLFDNA